MEYFMNAIFHIAGFLLFQRLLLMLIEQGKYEKYIRVVSGFLIILLLCSAVQQMTRGEGKLFDDILGQIEYTVQDGEFRRRLEQVEEQQKEEIYREYEKWILAEVQGYLERERYFLWEGQISFTEDGRVQQMELVIDRTWPGSIQPVEVQISLGEWQEENAAAEEQGKEWERIKGYLSECLGIRAEQISLRGGM